MYSYRYKIKIVKYFKKHGMCATLNAFRVKSRSSIYEWFKLYQIDKKLLHNESTEPNKIYIRENNWSYLIYDMIRSIRFYSPCLSKEKVFVRILKKFSNRHLIKVNSYP